MQDRAAIRIAIGLLGAVLVIGLWEAMPAFRAMLVSWNAEPRTVAARGDLAADEEATIALFEAAKGSVVSISTAERVVNPWTRDMAEVPRGTGSGFVWDEAGHIVTNHHVVAGASSATVRLADGRAYRARLVGTDPSHDLAVLRIGTGIAGPPPLPIGASGDLRVGQKVFAIGNPFGLDWSLTTGIVSALDRVLPDGRGGRIEGLVQTDAAINPGNSGGPLLDSAGRLIGVNTAIYSPSGASAGIGFAVPVDAVNRVVPQLIARGEYAPPSIGIVADPRADAQLRRGGVEGVAILRVLPGSAAERAGLRPARTTPEGGLVPGDIITGLGGEPVTGLEDLRSALGRHRAGEEVALEIRRGSERREIRLTLDPAA
jgi:S1-C subfamily serine protease